MKNTKAASQAIESYCRLKLEHAQRNYYSSARNQVIDIIIKRGYDRYEAECIFNALWKLHDRNPQKIAAAIVNLKGGNK